MSLDLTGIGSVADFASNLVNRFFPKSMDEKEKTAATIEIEQILGARDSALLSAQSTIISAEIKQDDKYTKRARPSVVYFGLFAIFLSYQAFPILIWLIQIISNTIIETPDISLPGEFWYTWGGVCSAWVLGRSVEKRAIMQGTNPFEKIVDNPLMKTLMGKNSR